MKTVEIILVFLFANNLLFFPFLGLAEGLGNRRRWLGVRPLASMALVLGVAALVLWFLENQLLKPAGLSFLNLPLSVLVLWGGSEGIRFLIPPASHQVGSRELLLNTLLLGAVWFLVRDASQWYDVLIGALAALVGYALSLAFLDILQSRLIREKVPTVVQGLPLQLVACGLVSLALTWTGR